MLVPTSAPAPLPIPAAPVLLDTVGREIRIKLPTGYEQSNLASWQESRGGVYEPLLLGFPGSHTDPDGTVVIPGLGTDYAGKFRLRVSASPANQVGQELIIQNSFLKPVASASTPFTITATFAQAPVNPTASYPLLKYNKRMGLHLMADDGGDVDYQVIPNVLNSLTGYTDGAGNALKPGFTYALTSLVNGLDARTTGSNPQVTTWEQYRTLKNQRHIGYSNHSSLHSPDNPRQQVADCQALVYDKLGVVLRTITVPGGFPGYVDAGLANPTILGIISQGYGSNRENADGHGDEIQYLDRMLVPYTPVTKYILSRYFVNQNWGTPTRTWFDEKAQLATTEFNAGRRAILSAFDHFPANQADNFASFLRYTQTHPLNVGGDSIWYANFQEFLEYEEVKKLCPISAPVISGNTVIWTINRAALPAASLCQDASLLLTGGTLTNVTVVGGDSFSVNTATGLVNIAKLGTPTVDTAPSLPPAPSALPAPATSGVFANSSS